MPAQNPCVLIATPTRGSPKMQYMQSVIDTIKDLAQRRIKSDFITQYGSLIALQRSLLATSFLQHHEFTHLFMVDDDMMFAPDLCARLLASDKLIVGTVATKRELDVHKVESALSRGSSLEQAFLAGYRWVVSLADDGTQNGPLRKVDILGFGAVLIKRQALDLMIEKGAVSQYPNPPDPEKFYGFFAPVSDEWAAEDTAFYLRWRQCGGEIWALTDVPIFHVGDFAYGGRYSTLLQAPLGTR